jgi:hypothetical protein
MQNQNFSEQITAVTFLALVAKIYRKKNPVLKISLLQQEELFNFS